MLEHLLAAGASCISVFASRDIGLTLMVSKVGLQQITKQHYYILTTTTTSSTHKPPSTTFKMPYTIKVRVYQTNPNAFFHIVEQGCWHYAKGATWSDHDGLLTLTMGDSGTSGMLRFKTEQGKEAFFIAMGVHNYKPWVDIVTGLADDVTCVKALPEYYGNSSERTRSRESQRTEQSILNIDRRTIASKFRVAQGNDLELDIIIG
ncbi:hypothetical protein ACHAPT_008892 [Fusarium lateritium]